MKIDELTIGEALELANLFGATRQSNEHPFEIEKPYMLRTVTHIDVGRIKAVYSTEIVITDAAWVADTGRFGEQWDKSGEDAFSEVEVFPRDADVIVGRGALVDAVQLKALPSVSKPLK